MALPLQTTKTWLNLSSGDRTSGTSNNFIIQMNNGGLTNNNAGYFGSKSFVNPIFMSFPNNAPNIRTDFNNVFYISGNKFAGTTPYAMLTIPEGVYQNIGQLTTAVQSAVNTYIGTTHGTTLPTAYTGTITVASNTTTNDLNYNKIVFTFVSPGSGETLNLYFYTGTPISFVSTNPLNFGLIIGTDENVFTIDATTTAHTLPYLPNLAVYDIIQVKCNLARSTLEIENGILSTSTILVSFPTANFVVNDQILFTNNNPTLYRQEMNTSNFDSIQISICDKNGNLIPISGEVDLSILIEREQYNEPINLNRIKDQNPYSADMFYQ